MKLHLYLFLLAANIGAVWCSDDNNNVDAPQEPSDNGSDAERMMARRKKRKKKKLATFAPTVELPPETRFTRSYITVIGQKLRVLSKDKAGSNKQLKFIPEMSLGSVSFRTGGLDLATLGAEKSIVGTTFLQAGPLYNPEDVKFVDCERKPNTPACKSDLDILITPTSTTGRVQRFRFGGGKQPEVDEELLPAVRNFFVDSECVTVAGFGASQVLAHNCLYNVCLGGKGLECVNIFAGGGFIFDPFEKTDDRTEPILPPSFAGAIIGGTGKYQGIKGSAQIVTISSRTAQQVISEDDNFPAAQDGYITQLIQLETSIPLPPSKTRAAP